MGNPKGPKPYLLVCQDIVWLQVSVDPAGVVHISNSYQELNGMIVNNLEGQTAIDRVPQAGNKARPARHEDKASMIMEVESFLQADNVIFFVRVSRIQLFDQRVNRKKLSTKETSFRNGRHY